MRKLIFSILIAAVTSVSSMPLVASADLQQKKQEANHLYQSGNYESAYSKYQKLARNGDGFAQYRVSYMNLMGQGGKENVIESLAWAVLAAQSQQEDLVNYMQIVAEMVPTNKRKKADKKIAQYMRKWGNDIGGSSAQRSDDVCTGSRLCNHSSTPRRVRMPSNLWTDNSNENDQHLKGKVVDLNQSILENHEGSTSTTTENQGTG